MAVTLGSITFDGENTTIDDRLEEVGGRDERHITISGLIIGESDVASIEAKLDAILDAASVKDYSSVLSLRAGRQLYVRRARFDRTVEGNHLVGSFSLVLLAKNPKEESTSETSASWNVSVSGATQAITPGGNTSTRPRFTLVATGTLVHPSISDGTRTITYEGIVADGETLVFDGPNAAATLEGNDVTPYTTGLFPEATPEGTTLTYSDDGSSSHTASITIAHRDQWW